MSLLVDDPMEPSPVLIVRILSHEIPGHQWVNFRSAGAICSKVQNVLDIARVLNKVLFNIWKKVKLRSESSLMGLTELGLPTPIIW